MFSKQIAFIESLPALFYEALEESVNEYGYVIKSYVINKQLYEAGEDGNNVRLQGYTRTTIRIKISKGQPADRTTLKDKGKFYLNISVNATTNEIVIKSNVKYDVHLIKKYGKAILIPSIENINDFLRSYVIPRAKEKIKARTGQM